MRKQISEEKRKAGNATEAGYPVSSQQAPRLCTGTRLSISTLMRVTSKLHHEQQNQDSNVFTKIVRFDQAGWKWPIP